MNFFLRINRAGTRLLLRRGHAALLLLLTLTGPAAISAAEPMLRGTGVWQTRVITTIGEPTPSSTSQSGEHWMPGFPDGMAVLSSRDGVVRILLNHELPPHVGLTYPLLDRGGRSFPMRGARISYVDIRIDDMVVVDSGIAYDTIINRRGLVVGGAPEFGDVETSYGGLAKLCSSNIIRPDPFGPSTGPVETIYLTGEEWGYNIGGSFFALFPDDRELVAIPDWGYGSWENAAMIDTGEKEHVAFLLADDFYQAPLYLYVGRRNPDGGRLERNGLAGGSVFVWVADSGVNTPRDFRGTGAVANGHWVPLPVRNRTGTSVDESTDSMGYFKAHVLRAMAASAGAFRFSRPEDIATSPDDPSTVVFASTGAGHIFPEDNWGAVYRISTRLEFEDQSGSFAPSASGATVTILYDCDAPSGDWGIRSPDNLEWSASGRIFVQEDNASFLEPFAGESGMESSIWSINANGLRPRRVAEITRIPSPGTTDIHAKLKGAWESSGIIDASAALGMPSGSAFLVTVQAHGVHDGPISEQNLYEGGQLLLLWNTVAAGHAGFLPEKLLPSAETHDLRANPESDPPGFPELGPFTHGVASGEPGPDSIRLWTRYHPIPDSNIEQALFWEISLNPSFAEIARSGQAVATADAGGTVSVTITGLAPGQVYYYRFHDGNFFSLVGRTRTLPDPTAEKVEFLLASCSNFQAGYFSAFSDMARFPGIHAVLFLGDFIYESGAGREGDPLHIRDRVHNPPHKAMTLEDYRNRYAQYVADPHLLHLRASHPFIHTPDDHEVADGAWADGALSHDNRIDGDYPARKQAALRAFREWCPLPPDTEPLYRDFSIGNLVHLTALDTRHHSRDPILVDSNDPALMDPGRTMLGPDQFEWLSKTLTKSTARWKMIANQVLFSELNLWWAAPAVGLTPHTLESSLLDSWDGYPSERSRLLKLLGGNGIDNTVIFTGDTHSSWVFQVVENVDTANPDSDLGERFDSASGDGALATEFGIPSITSGNWDEFFTSLGHDLSRSGELTSVLQSYINQPLPFPGGLNPNPHLRFTELQSHGFAHAVVTAGHLTVQYHYLHDARDPHSRTYPHVRFRLEAGSMVPERLPPIQSFGQWVTRLEHIHSPLHTSGRLEYQTDPESDADMDDLTLYEEFIYGLSPRDPDRPFIALRPVSEGLSEWTIELAINRYVDESDLIPEVKSAVAVDGPWVALEHGPVSIAPLNDNLKLLQITLPEIPDPGRTRFYQFTLRTP